MNAQERRNIEQLVRNIVADGNVISIWDGEEWAVRRSNGPEVIMAGMGLTDEDTLVVRNPETTELGRIYFVYGNDPDEVVADYTDNAYIESHIDRVNWGA